MKKLFTIALLITGVFATENDTVQYAGTTYGPSDTTVHYDMRSNEKEKSTIRENHPNDKLYTSDDRK